MYAGHVSTMRIASRCTSTRRSTSSKIVQSSRSDRKPTFIRCSRMFPLWNAIPLFRYDCFCYSCARESAWTSIGGGHDTHACTYTRICARRRVRMRKRTGRPASLLGPPNRSIIRYRQRSLPNAHAGMCVYVCTCSAI